MIPSRSREKADYLTALNEADTGDLPSFRKSIREKVPYSLKLGIKGGSGESLEEVDGF